jgi:hypothetical protein
MAAVSDVDELIERYHLALGEFMKGNPEPAKRLWSAREDASLTNPQGSVARGWAEVAEAMDRAASTRRSGRFLGFETVAKRVTDYRRACLRGGGRALRSQGSRRARDHPIRP